jgi:hypothetical protein
MTGPDEHDGASRAAEGPTSAASGPPWWRVEVDDAAHRRSIRRAGAAGALVRVLPARRMPTLPALYARFAQTWDFPDYFGHNPSALEDCLTDLAWAPAPTYVCVIDRAEELLIDEPPQVLALLVDLLSRVGAFWGTPVALGEPWDRPARPFRTVLLASSPERAGTLHQRLDAAGCR